MDEQFYVYIMANKRNGTIYIGVTNDLARRAYEHRQGLVQGLTKRYGLKMLVYYEAFDSILNAIQRDKPQAMAAQMETRFDREAQPAVARSLRRSRLVAASPHVMAARHAESMPSAWGGHPGPLDSRLGLRQGAAIARGPSENPHAAPAP